MKSNERHYGDDRDLPISEHVRRICTNERILDKARGKAIERLERIEAYKGSMIDKDGSQREALRRDIEVRKRLLDTLTEREYEDLGGIKYGRIFLNS